jgi:MFS transporter, NNP family, nitrate/nitrite transporter
MNPPVAAGVDGKASEVMRATYNEAAHSYTIGLVLLTITASGALLFTLFGIRRKTPAPA